jgi:hypothetical protein
MVAAIAAIASMTYGSGAIGLTNGVPVAGLSGGADTEVFYRIAVPAGQGELQISISGGTGDCDLYVKRDGPPSLSNYDYRPYQAGNDETVAVTDPASGDWYILLRGHEAYGDVALVAGYKAAVATALENGVVLAGLAGGADSETLYAIDVPPGQAELEVITWGGTGDVDVFVKRGSPPSPSDFDRRSVSGRTDEWVTVRTPVTGTWYILLSGREAYSAVLLKAVYRPRPSTPPWNDPSDDATPLTEDVLVTGLSGEAGSEQFFEFDVPQGATRLEFWLSGGTGNADMYIKEGTEPTTSSWDFHPSDEENSNHEVLIITGSDFGGRWYILIKAAQAFQGVTLLARYSSPADGIPAVVTLSNGVPVSDISGAAGAEKFYKIEVPAGRQKLEIRMSGGTGDADLYVRKDFKPTTSEYDYRPYLTGNNEAVTIDRPSSGTWYIMIRGYQSFADITLTATFDSASPDTVTALQNGLPVIGLIGGHGGERFFKIEVPAGQTQLEIAMSGGMGDADLYVRLGAKPTTREWDYRPFVFGNRETVTINHPKAGTYYIMVRGYMAYSGVTLTATYVPAPEEIKALANCVPVAGLSGAQDSEVFFKIDVPAGQAVMRIEISGGTGDADLYVKKGEKPTTKSWDYRPHFHGNEEGVAVQNPAATTWYIMVQGYQAYSGLSLKACFHVSKEECDDCVIVVFDE